ncbi:MAG: EAL domain-containing protein [Sulfuricurvum sp.]|nr:EAL domain-containing protein [Sulfuricurvum sp.]
MKLFRTIKGRLLLSILVIHSLLMGLVIHDLIDRQHHFMTQQLLRKATSFVSLLSSNAAMPMQNNDLTALGDLLKDVGALPDVSMIFVMDTDGRIRASYPEGYFNQTLTDTVSVKMLKGLESTGKDYYESNHDGLTDVIRSIKIGGQAIGYCRIIMNNATMAGELTLLTRQGVLYIIAAIVLGVFLAWLVVRQMTSRITMLSEATAQLTEKNFDVKIPEFKGEDEISKMGRAFQLMVESLKLYVNKLAYRADHDELTELPNRRLFLDRLDQAIKHAERSGRHVAVLFIDLDHFKEINDSLGHLIGDQVLIHVARMIQTHFRDIDTIARLGGDEFSLIIDSLEGIESVSTVAEKLVTLLQHPICIDKRELYVTCSIGISIYPNDGELPENLLRNADSAMYKAKSEGRNSYQFYTEDMTQKALERVALEADLRRALEREEFRVYYQPQVNGISGQLIGMEALVRWQHPELGLVSPVKFIPLAVETGLIILIDRFVMRTGMMQLKQWHDEGLNPGILALNLTIKQLKQDDFISMLQEMMEDTGCLPKWLELEVTEGEVMQNPEQAVRVLKQVSVLGIKLAIDDFGTGYSSLAYLKRLPVDKLKIDQSFVREIPGDEEDVAIVGAIIALSKSLHLDIIAEGVETQEQKEFLTANGCEQIQGYLYGRPMRAEDMDQMLREKTVWFTET